MRILTELHGSKLPDLRERRGIFGVHLDVANTGWCFVTARRIRHAEDDGWEIRRFTAIHDKRSLI